MQTEERFYHSHVFCCTNQRDPGVNCCAAKNSVAAVTYFKEKCKELGLTKVRINQSGCLGRCKYGKVMVIYPEGVWYHYDNNSDIDQIIETHLIKGEIHQTLKLNQDKI